jgi:hypothetical protein
MDKIYEMSKISFPFLFLSCLFIFFFLSYLLHLLFSFPLFLYFSFYFISFLFSFLFIFFFLSNLLHVFFSFSLLLSFSLSFLIRSLLPRKPHRRTSTTERPVLLRSASNPAISLQLPCASIAVPTSAFPDPRRRELANISVPPDPAASNSATPAPATSISASPAPALGAHGLQLRVTAPRPPASRCRLRPPAPPVGPEGKGWKLRDGAAGERGSYDFQLPSRRTAPVTVFPDGFSARAIFLAPLARLRAK